jgi:hypothetical protein
MARHILSLEDRVRGIRAALNSDRTPSHLRTALRQQLVILEQRLKHERENKKRQNGSRVKRVGLLDWLRL